MQTSKFIMKLLKDSLSNGPHLVSPQYAQKVIGTHILKDISNNFASGHLEDPVYLYPYPIKSESLCSRQHSLAWPGCPRQLCRSAGRPASYCPRCSPVKL